MLTMNKVEYTYDSLESLLARADVPCELVVVDNGSTDETLDLLSRLRNVTVVRNESNRGFGPACNQGAARARGEYLLVLNNDAEIAPGCLSALLRTARAEPRCGAVGGKLVWPDGRLQEAGSILWDDGTAEACGRGGDPGAPEASYLREVDFCSGALLLVRRELFQTLGGFDDRFSPIYYEDVDLCVGIRGLGFRVLYQPAAVVRHQEYGTTSARATELMRRNQARFVEKRQAELAGQHPRADGSLRARERTARPRLLVIDDRVPTSDAGSGYPRAHALLRLLRQRDYPVTFFPAYDPTPYQPWLRELQLAGVEMICDGRPFASFAAERAGLYDVVLVSRPHNLSAVQADLTRSFPRAILIYDAEALFFVREKAEAAIGEGSVLPELPERQRRELDLFRFAHRIVAVSEREKRFLERAAPEYRGQIEVWGHPVEVRPTPSPFAERRDLLFLGSFFAPGSPNKDALNVLVRDVLPLVTARLDCRLDVVGHSAAAAVAGYASERVAVLGYAEDLTPHYDAHRVLGAPPLFGGDPPQALRGDGPGTPGRGLRPDRPAARRRGWPGGAGRPHARGAGGVCSEAIYGRGDVERAPCQLPPVRPPLPRPRDARPRPRRHRRRRAGGRADDQGVRRCPSTLAHRSSGSVFRRSTPGGSSSSSAVTPSAVAYRGTRTRSTASSSGRPASDRWRRSWSWAPTRRITPLQLASRPGVRRVVALEGREDNVRRARLVLEAFGATNVDFRHHDVEQFEPAEFGRFDAVFCAGLLYHLREPWVLVGKLAGLCRFLFLDTHYAATAEATAGPYRGRWHGEGTDPLSGLSTRSFWLTFKDLLLLLMESGFLVRYLHDGGNGEGDRLWLFAEQVGTELVGSHRTAGQ